MVWKVIQGTMSLVIESTDVPDLSFPR